MRTGVVTQPFFNVTVDEQGGGAVEWPLPQDVRNTLLRVNTTALGSGFPWLTYYRIATEINLHFRELLN